jgi:hypothetical protein
MPYLKTDMPIRKSDMSFFQGRATHRFLRDAADRYSDPIADDAKVTREAPDAVQADLALK